MVAVSLKASCNEKIDKAWLPRLRSSTGEGRTIAAEDPDRSPYGSVTEARRPPVILRSVSKSVGTPVESVPAAG